LASKAKVGIKVCNVEPNRLGWGKTPRTLYVSLSEQDCQSR